MIYVIDRNEEDKVVGEFQKLDKALTFIKNTKDDDNDLFLVKGEPSEVYQCFRCNEIVTEEEVCNYGDYHYCEHCYNDMGFEDDNTHQEEANYVDNANARDINGRS